MQHLDEGTIHEWLDGALAPDDAARVAAHVDSCAACAGRVAEARGFIAAATRILTALDDVPGGVIPAVQEPRAASPTDLHPSPPEATDELALRRAAARSRMARVRAAAAVVVVAAGTALVLQHGVGRGRIAAPQSDILPISRPVAEEPMAASAPALEKAGPPAAPGPVGSARSAEGAVAAPSQKREVAQRVPVPAAKTDSRDALASQSQVTMTDRVMRRSVAKDQTAARMNEVAPAAPPAAARVRGDYSDASSNASSASLSKGAAAGAAAAAPPRAEARKAAPQLAQAVVTTASSGRRACYHLETGVWTPPLPDTRAATLPRRIATDSAVLDSVVVRQDAGTDQLVVRLKPAGELLSGTAELRSASGEPAATAPVTARRIPCEP